MTGALFPLGRETHLIDKPRPFNARSETVEEKNYLVEVGNAKGA